MIAWESKTAAQRAEKVYKDRLMGDPMEPTIEGEGIILASHLRDIFVNVRLCSSSTEVTPLFHLSIIFSFCLEARMVGLWRKARSGHSEASFEVVERN